VILKLLVQINEGFINMKKFVLTIMVLLSAASFNASACSCGPVPYFLKAAMTTHVEVALHIKVLQNNDDGSIDAQVLYVFKGDLSVSQIKIWANNFCGTPRLIGFDDGTEWIVPLFKMDNEQNQYIHSACLDPLFVENLNVTGFITDRFEQTDTLESFKELWNLYSSALQFGWEQCTTAASGDLSGIWAGTVNSNWSGSDANYEQKIYLSIRQTTDHIVVIILSSVEATTDLFSSTYLGQNITKLESIGAKAYFPDFSPIKQSLSYVNTSLPIQIDIHPGGQSGLVHVLCETCAISSVIVIQKIL
jgi:hypothetical protein